MKRHAGAHDISLDELKSERAMYRKDAAGLSCDMQRRRLSEKDVYNEASVFIRPRPRYYNYIWINICLSCDESHIYSRMRKINSLADFFFSEINSITK